MFFCTSILNHIKGAPQIKYLRYVYLVLIILKCQAITNGLFQNDNIYAPMQA